MKVCSSFVMLLFAALLNAQNPISTWELTLADQQEIVLVDSDFEKTYMLYRFGDGSNPHTYDVWIWVDGAFLLAPGGAKQTLEEESTAIVRGKKIVLVRDPTVYSGTHFLQGNFKAIESDQVFVGPSVSFSAIKGNNNPTTLFDIDSPRRVRIGVDPIANVGIKPYVILYVDGVEYKHNGVAFKLQEGSSIELYCKSVAVYYPSTAPSLPSGSEFLRGALVIFDN